MYYAVEDNGEWKMFLNENGKIISLPFEVNSKREAKDYITTLNKLKLKWKSKQPKQAESKK